MARGGAEREVEKRRSGDRKKSSIAAAVAPVIASRASRSLSHLLPLPNGQAIQ